MYNLYKVTNGYLGYDEEYRVVIAKDDKEAKHLAMVSFREEATQGLYDSDYYTGLVVTFVGEFEYKSQAIW